MTLSASQLEAREGRLTASRVACLMTADRAKIMNLWREMVGDPGYIEADLSGIWAVRLGAFTEALNLDWYERKTGRPVTRRGEVVVHPEIEWAACTLDGWDDSIPRPIEAKHVGGREPRSRIIDRYTPQLSWQMMVTGTTQAALCLIEGAAEPVIEPLDLSPEYAEELWKRAHAFMECVRTLTPPFKEEIAA